MKKLLLIPVLALSVFLTAGKYKVSKVGQSDVYVPTLESDAKTLKVESLQGPGSVPIGGMVAVMPNIQANDAWQPPATGVIKDGFMRANGHVITAQNVTDGSKLRAGTTLPNMEAKYPRGNTTSGTTGGANTVTLAVANIPQMSGSFTSVGMSANASHSHSDNGHAHSMSSAAAYYPNADAAPGSGIPRASGGQVTGVNTGYASIAATNTDHTHNTTVTLGTASPTATNNEPAYTEVVWVIRVK